MACRCVARTSAIRRASAAPSMAAPREASTSRAPVVSGSHRSRPDMSKANVATATQTSSGRRPGSRVTEATKLARAPRSMQTPFGWPVEPEV
ncbi:MAG: hypothetical protein AUG44_00040 [Actinobacteria bacterium 13_1_20CM_3_71_11]|nr:MAG: hypothetical protein AUG44_00040 [Actinobacteria bacterium 13_1_20CM_3_71_11]